MRKYLRLVNGRRVIYYSMERERNNTLLKKYIIDTGPNSDNSSTVIDRVKDTPESEGTLMEEFRQMEIDFRFKENYDKED